MLMHLAQTTGQNPTSEKQLKLLVYPARQSICQCSCRPQQAEWDLIVFVRSTTKKFKPEDTDDGIRASIDSSVEALGGVRVVFRFYSLLVLKSLAVQSSSSFIARFFGRQIACCQCGELWKSTRMLGS